MQKSNNANVGLRSAISTLIAIVVICVQFTSCGGQQPSAQPSGTEATRQMLEAKLFQALAERGIDPAKSVASAPWGQENQVFDLEAVLNDPDGPGGMAAAGAELSWTEVLSGDYDCNSEVGYPDLVPLAEFFFAEVDYADASAHGGCTFWPNGDPEGDTAARHNWRLARIDGDYNGECNVADIIAIAMNWNTRLAGYNVYAKAPGSDEFELAEPLERPQPLAIPVRYHFDYTFAAPGVYEFYVAPYDMSGTEGIASPLLRIDTAAGTVRHQPVARLDASPWTGSSSVTSTLNASTSYARDGGVAMFLWDFDGDGIVDWNSTEALPAASSSGQVDGFTVDIPYIEVKPGMVRAIFHKGAEQYIYATVRVVDANGWESAPCTTSIRFD